MTRPSHLRFWLFTTSLAAPILLCLLTLNSEAQYANCSGKGSQNTNTPCGDTSTCASTTCAGWFTDGAGAVVRCGAQNPLATSNCVCAGVAVNCGNGGACATNPDTGLCVGGPGTPKTVTPCGDAGPCNVP